MMALQRTFSLLLILTLGGYPLTMFEAQGRGPPFLDAVGGESQSRYTTVPFSVLSKAMLGVDPILSNPLGEQDPGLKDQIFIPSSSFINCGGAIKLNDFIGKAVQDVRCNHLSASSMQTASNFQSYKSIKSESVSFRNGAELSVGLRGFGVKAHVGYESVQNTDERKYLEFFKQTGGEIVHGGAQCQTHVVSVNIDVKPVFSENFLSALRMLNDASMDPLSEKSRKIFFNFVEDYGTHFQGTTFLGSKLVVEKLYSKRSTNSRVKNERHRCVASSFTQSLKVNAPFAEAEENFRRNSNHCSGLGEVEHELNSLGLSSERIRTVGTAPYLDSEEWARHALQSPVPIKYNLEKISSLFVQDWFSSLPGTLNGPAMHEFFENMSSQYCEIMIGAPCDHSWKGCGFNSNCKEDEKCIDDDTTVEGFSCRKGCGITGDCPDRMACVDDDSMRGFACHVPCSYPDACPDHEACYPEPHSAKGFICVSTESGQAVVAGGWGFINGLERPLKAVQHINYKTFPELPRAVYNGALVAAGNFIYICGGNHQDIDENYYSTDNCYRAHRRNPDEKWMEMQSAPKKIGYASVVSINDSSLWFVQGHTLVKFDINTEQFSTTTLPFTAHSYHCSVANGSHAFIIGAGEHKDEIWVNQKSLDETAWRKVRHMTRSVHKHACLWYDSNIMITGGSPERSNVDIFNTETGEIWSEANLLTGRDAHRMMLYDGMPTVIGGYSGGYLDSIESFRISEKKWIKQSKTLPEVNGYFSLVEI